MPRRSVLVLLSLAVAITACVSSSPAPSGGPSATGSPSAAGSVGAPSASGAGGFPAAGQPYSADDILSAMRDSPRPDGVPDELENPAVAGAIAEAIWTFDGEPWSDMSIGGSCGAQTCAVDVVGTRAGSEGEDLWSFEVTPDDASVEVTQRELGAVPDGVRTDLDALARSLASGGQLDDLVLGSVTWEPPPEPAAFTLAYRSGNEEGSCAVDVVLDPVERRVLDSRASDC